MYDMGCLEEKRFVVRLTPAASARLRRQSLRRGDMSRLVVEAIRRALDQGDDAAHAGVRAFEGASRPDRTSIKIPVDLLAQLEQRAALLGTSKAALVDWGLSLKKG